MNGFDAVEGVLEVGGCDNDGLNIFVVVELVIVADAGNGAATALLLNKGGTFVTATVPDIGDGHELEVELLGVILEGGHERTLGPVTGANQSYPDTIISAHDGCVTVRRPGNDRACECRATYL